jgi:hypothetical protein
MSIASPSIALPEASAARVARPAPSRLALLFAVILVTSVAAVVLSVVSYLRPAGNSDIGLAYRDIEPMRGYLWAFFVVGGVQLIVGVCAAALAGWILAPARGARWATVGGSMIWLGAAVYGVGIGGWAAFYYFASDTSALNPATATSLIDHANDDPRLLAVPIGGAALIMLGSLVLAVGLWRARTVPRWVVVFGIAASLATILLPPSTAAGVIGETVSSITTIAIGWYAWKPWAGASAASR